MNQYLLTFFWWFYRLFQFSNISLIDYIELHQMILYDFFDLLHTLETKLPALLVKLPVSEEKVLLAHLY